MLRNPVLSGAVAVLSALAFPALAAADAPDVTANSMSATSVQNGSTVTVTVSGAWQWTTRHSNCNTDRAGVGIAIDWNDPNQPGNVVATLDGVPIDVGAAVANALNPADNAVHPTTGAVFSCGTFNGSYNTGEFGSGGEFRHTYSADALPATICALTYDVHGQPGQPSATSETRAGGDGHNLDNSAQRNAATPAGNICRSVPVTLDGTTNAGGQSDDNSGAGGADDDSAGGSGATSGGSPAAGGSQGPGSSDASPPVTFDPVIPADPPGLGAGDRGPSTPGPTAGPAVVPDVPPALLRFGNVPLGSLPAGLRPAAGTNVLVAPVGGQILLQNDAGAFVPMPAAARLPVGTVVDATRGVITLVSRDPEGGTETAVFTGAKFQVRQAPNGLTALILRGGSFRDACGSVSAPADDSGASTRSATAAAARARSKKVVRTLWASDHNGHFQTHGRNSVATVRGTVWQTVDRCDGTLTRVVVGEVVVHDRRTHRNVVVAAGHSYLARDPLA